MDAWGKYAGTRVDVGKSELRLHRCLRHMKFYCYKPMCLIKDVLGKNKKPQLTIGTGREQEDLMPGFGFV